jgi:hypothetical protein
LNKFTTLYIPIVVSKSIPASFDREFVRVKEESELVADKLKAIRFRIRALEKSSEDAKNRQYDSLRVSRFVGNIEQALQTYAQMDLLYPDIHTFVISTMQEFIEGDHTTG